MDKLSGQEYDIMDELYFVISFEELLKILPLDRNILKRGLSRLVEKRWVKCFQNPEQDIDFDDVDYENQFNKYYYLATKEGLFVHNSR